ncbi:G-protein coupled receptor 54-like [Macrobrachium rosenbergii]|uniref:G-protein coupled receptor 54-like n=1 Tax=Macrobrachium rosenbergii TaxID=79674 RepID=UPI0034D3B2FE
MAHAVLRLNPATACHVSPCPSLFPTNSAPTWDGQTGLQEMGGCGISPYHPNPYLARHQPDGQTGFCGRRFLSNCPAVMTPIARARQERCYAIIYPMKAIYVCTISKARKATIVIWIASFILASPNLLIRIHMEVGVRVRAYWCVNNFDAPLTWRAYETYMMVLVLVLPVCVMAVAYTSIGIAIVKVVGQRRTITARAKWETAEITANGQGGPGTGSLPTEDKTVRQVVPMLIVVVVLFLICWGPILVLNILQAFDVVPLYDVWAMHAKTALDLLSYVNSSTNPIVYGFMSRNFRKGFRRALCSVVRQDEGHHSLSQSHTLRPVTGANRWIFKAVTLVIGDQMELVYLLRLVSSKKLVIHKDTMATRDCEEFE